MTLTSCGAMATCFAASARSHPPARAKVTATKMAMITRKITYPQRTSCTKVLIQRLLTRKLASGEAGVRCESMSISSSCEMSEQEKRARWASD